MFETASELLAYSNQYMDSLEGRPPKSPEESEERVRTLRTLISEMRRFNFHAPKFGIRSLFKDLVLAEKEEILEAMPLVQEFIYSLNVRQWTYERAKVAYLSNKLAWSILTENWLEEFLTSLPYGGEYLSFTSKGGGASYLVFRDIERMLRGEKRYEAVFKDETLVDVRSSGKKGPVMRTTALLLASLSVSKSLEEHWEEILEEERRKIKNYDEVLRYERILSRYDIKKVNENPELLWRLLQELEEAGFLEKDGTVRSDIIRSVKERRAFRQSMLMEYSLGYLSLFLIKYYAYFRPWKLPHPLRGMPKKLSELQDILSEIRVDNCHVTRNRVLYVAQSIEHLDALPLDRRAVAEALLHLLCPSWERPYPEIEKVLKELGSPSERARRFMEVLKDDKNKKEGRFAKSKKGP